MKWSHLKKSVIFFFLCGKKQGPNQWFCSDKKSKQNKKNSKKKKKKILQLICADIVFKMVCGNLFKEVLRCLSFGDFKVPKNCSSITMKLLIKLNWQKIKKILHTALKAINSQIIIKFLEDRIKPWRVGALGVCTGYHFFKRKLLVMAF